MGVTPARRRAGRCATAAPTEHLSRASGPTPRAKRRVGPDEAGGAAVLGEVDGEAAKGQVDRIAEVAFGRRARPSEPDPEDVRCRSEHALARRAGTFDEVDRGDLVGLGQENSEA